MKQSVWVASSRNIEQYKKYKSSSIIDDVTSEFSSYLSFNNVDKRIIIGRIMNSIKQSLRVRGINVLFRMRKHLISNEKQITDEIRTLQQEVNIAKVVMKDNAIDLNDPNTSITSVIHYFRYREEYLKAKIRLESKILERKNIRKHLRTDANDILKEQY